MNARHTAPDETAVDWSAALRLAFVASVLAALAAVVLADRFSEQTIVLLVIVAASIASWSQVDVPVATPGRVPPRARR